MCGKLKNKLKLSILALAAAVIAYNVYDNNRIAVKEQVVYIDNLPQEFDGFRILQLSDLHGKRFGEGQSYLISKVNNVDYDIITFSGDMESASDSDLAAFTELLKGLKNKEYIFYVNGNDDVAYSSMTGNVYSAGDKLRANGCILLTEPYPIKRSGSTLWISNYFNKSTFGDLSYKSKIFRGNQQEYAAYKGYTADLEKIFYEIKDTSDIKIAVTHIPFTSSDFTKTDQDGVLDYSLILAGHYHGGQFRLPFYGALYIPADQHDGGGLFPDQKYVSGLVDFGGIQQFVSGGLGSSNIPFRLFNTPEINLIVLKEKQ